MQRVGPREHLGHIAARRGVVDLETLWAGPENEALRQVRDDPGVLAEGDVVGVPDASSSRAACDPGTRNVFVMDVPNVQLRVRLVDPGGAPRAALACVLSFLNESLELMTDAEGLVEAELPATIDRATLVLDDAHLTLSIGGLDPVGARSGQIARLRNLGYLAVGPSGQDVQDYMFRRAVEEFQLEHALKVDGIVGERTRAKLVTIHGS